MIGLLLTYLFIIPKYEAPSIPSFERYMGTILLPIMMFHIIIAIEKIENMNIWKIGISVIILLIILPTNDIAKKNDKLDKRRYKRVRRKTII